MAAQSLEERDVLQHRRGEHDQVGARDDAEIVAAVRGAALERRVDDLVVDRDDDAAGHRRLAASAIDPPIRPNPTIAMRAKRTVSRQPAFGFGIHP